jgi:hypothetical protein
MHVPYVGKIQPRPAESQTLKPACIETIKLHYTDPGSMDICLAPMTVIASSATQSVTGQPSARDLCTCADEVCVFVSV